MLLLRGALALLLPAAMACAAVSDPFGPAPAAGGASSPAPSTPATPSAAPPTSAPPVAPAENFDLEFEGIVPPSPSLDSRWLSYFCVDAAAVGWNPPEVEQALGVLASMQDTNPQDATYGGFRITYQDTVLTDPNVGVFVMQSLIVLWDAYRSALTPTAQSLVRTMLTLGQSEVAAYDLQPTYTNMYLEKAFVSIGLGEIFGNSAEAQVGYGMLSSWLSFTEANGIAEFCSPSYYGVCLDAMGMVERFAAQPQGVQDATTIADLLWMDIAGNWYAPSERLCGPHSRDHDYVLGHGKLDVQLAGAGWLQQRSPDMAECFPPVGSGYMAQAQTTPPPQAVALRDQAGVRTVSARWGGGFWQQRWNYCSTHCSLGVSGGSYNMEDKLIEANLGSGDGTPNLCYVLDGQNDPYGQVPTPNTVGEDVLQHLTPVVSAQQQGADAVVVIDEALSGGASQLTTLTSVTSNLLLPADVQVLAGSTPVALPAPGGSINLPGNVPLFFQRGDAVLGVRMLAATDVSGGSPAWTLVCDGGSWGMCRLSCTHAGSPPPESGFAVQLALHLAVADGLDAAGMAGFEHTFSATSYDVTTTNGVLSVSASTAQDGTLAAAVDTRAHVPVQPAGSSSSATAAATTTVLGIDGTDIGSPLVQGQGIVLPKNNGSGTPLAAAGTGTAAPGGGGGCGLGSGVALLGIGLAGTRAWRRRRSGR